MTSGPNRPSGGPAALASEIRCAGPDRDGSGPERRSVGDWAFSTTWRVTSPIESSRTRQWAAATPLLVRSRVLVPWSGRRANVQTSCGRAQCPTDGNLWSIRHSGVVRWSPREQRTGAMRSCACAIDRPCEVDRPSVRSCPSHGETSAASIPEPSWQRSISPPLRWAQRSPSSGQIRPRRPAGIAAVPDAGRR